MLYCPCLVSHALPAGVGCIVLPSNLQAVLFVVYCPAPRVSALISGVVLRIHVGHVLC
jgi:hypothetical protein